MELQANYKTVGADVVLGKSCTKNEIRDFKKYKENLDNAKNIKLFDANQDGKFDDNEFLLIENQDGSKEVLFNPIKGIGPDKIKKILKEGGLTTTSEIKNPNYLKFLKISVESTANKDNAKQVSTTDETTALEMKRSKEKGEQILKKLREHGYDFSVKIVDNCFEITLLKPKKESYFFGLFSSEIKPSFGELKKILNLPDGTFSEQNNIYELANRENAPGRLSGYFFKGSNNFDTWTLEPNQPFRIPSR